MHNDPWDGEGKVILQCWEDFFQLVKSHSHRDCLFFFVLLQHGAFAKAYDMYIDLLNERHKGKCLLVFALGSSKQQKTVVWYMNICFMAMMIGAGVRTSARSWELNANCLFQCCWHVAGSLETGLHETLPKTEPC